MSAARELRLLLLLFLAASLSGASEWESNWRTVDGGGAIAGAGGDFSLGGAAGQPDAGICSGGAYQLRGGFWVFLPPPRLTGISPTGGRMGGGASAGISGADFQDGATVQFDTSAAGNVLTTSSSVITCSTPAHVAGPADVTVINPDGQYGTLADAYTYTGWEGDIAPRAEFGDEDLLAGDLSQQRRFVAGLDAVQAGPEFQRADVAPLATRGDGNLLAGDLSQQRRYVAGLDPFNGAGGPTAFSGLKP